MKKILSLVLTIAMLATMCVFTSVSAAAEQWNGQAATEFSGGGDGTAANPYKIGTAGELKRFADIVNGGQYASCGTLTADITLNVGDLNGYNGTDANNWVVWTPIGDYDYPYNGTFNGGGYTISGLYLNDSAQMVAGLFGKIQNAAIENLGIVNGYINADDSIGGLCGVNGEGSTVTNCYNSVTIVGVSSIGGVCGYNAGAITGCYNIGIVRCNSNCGGGVCGYNEYRGTITNCYNAGTLSCIGNSIGGVCGLNYGGAVTGCYNIGKVSSLGNNVGGVCGRITNGTTTDCYNTGAVNGNEYIGGVCGEIEESSTITDCYNTGMVIGGADIGGVSGYLESQALITNCYNQGTVIGSNYIGGVCGYINYNFGTASGGTIRGSYNTGDVNGNNSVGGIGGYIFGGAIQGCHNTGAVSGTTYVGGIFGDYYQQTVNTVTGCYSAGAVSGTSNVGGIAGHINGNADGSCFYLGTCAATGTTLNDKFVAKAEADMKAPEFVALLNANGGDFTYCGGSFPAQSWQRDGRGLSITYTVAPIYTVTIPDEIRLGGTAEVSAENVVLNEGKQLQIALTATGSEGNAFTVSNGKTATLAYEVTDSGDNTVSVNDTVLTVNPTDSARGSTTLKFSSPTNAVIYSGSYTGTVTFTVSVQDSPVSFFFAPDIESMNVIALSVMPGTTWREWVASADNTYGLQVLDVEGITSCIIFSNSISQDIYYLFTLYTPEELLTHNGIIGITMADDVIQATTYMLGSGGE